MQTILKELAYEPIHHIPNSDDYIVIETHPYEKRTFGQFREIAYDFNALGAENRGEMLKRFVEDRAMLQPTNQVLHNHTGKIPLTTLLETMCEWKSYPKTIAKTKFIKARWLYTHGNWKAFIGDDGTQFWYVYWLGS